MKEKFTAIIVVLLFLAGLFALYEGARFEEPALTSETRVSSNETHNVTETIRYNNAETLALLMSSVLCFLFVTAIVCIMNED